MASCVKQPTCVTAEFTYSVNSRRAYSCKPCANPSSPRLSSFTPRPTIRRSFQVQCNLRSLKQAKPMTVSELREKFGSPNLEFLDVAGMTVIELKLNSGNAVRVLVHQARITSYKCRLWHGSLEDFLYTDVSEPASGGADDGTNGLASSVPPPQFRIVGGIFPSVAHSIPPHRPLFEDEWFVDRVQVDPEEQIQVTLRNADESQGGWQYTSQCIITLTKRYLASCLMITNNGKKSMMFTGSITTHLAISSTEALCAAGLQGCKYFSPSEAAQLLTVKRSTDNSLFGRFKGFVLRKSTEKDQGDSTVSSVEGTSQMEEKNFETPYQDPRNWFTEKEEEVVYFKNGVHKLYSEPFKQIRMTDLGFRRSLLFESYGFGNFEISSPTSDGEKPFVSVGCASILSPVMLSPKSVWRSAQILGPDTE